MAKQIEGVSEKILACAKQEFLAKGYTDASLRIIAAAADTSTNSIYVRFQGKEGLFSAIVEPVVNGMMERFVAIQEQFHQKDSREQETELNDYALNGMESLVDYMYDHLDEFRLLLDASYGTKFHNFVDRMVQVEVDYTYKYMEAIGCPEQMGGTMTETVLHIVTTAYFEGIFEVVRHGMDRAEAKRYIDLLGRYHHTGFAAVFPQLGQ